MSKNALPKFILESNSTEQEVEADGGTVGVKEVI